MLQNCNNDNEFHNKANTNAIIIVCYDISDNNNMIGYVKYGYKHLFLYTKQGKVIEKDILCVLDIYVLESKQRNGIGKLLLEHVLRNEHPVNKSIIVQYYNKYNTFPPLECLQLQYQLIPCQLAYDRPSPKLISFMRKNYNYVHNDLQPNKYMLFEDFWKYNM